VRQHELRAVPTTTEGLTLVGPPLEGVVAAACAIADEKGRRSA
jgi:hypothetical protein